jgi:hypothetical protein
MKKYFIGFLSTLRERKFVRAYLACAAALTLLLEVMRLCNTYGIVRIEQTYFDAAFLAAGFFLLAACAALYWKGAR